MSITLDRLPPQQEAVIESADWSQLAPDEVKRLQALGLEEGARVTVMYRGICGATDPLALKIGRSMIAVRRVHAQALTVTPR